MYLGEFKKHVPSLKSYLSESLFRDNWRNYANDTYLTTDSPSKETLSVMEVMVKIFGVGGADELIFTTNDISFGEDYLQITDKVKMLQPKIVKTVNLPGRYILYITLYDLEGVTVSCVDMVSDESTNGFVFIKDVDFDKISGEEDDEDIDVDDDGATEGADGGGTGEDTKAQDDFSDL